MSSRKTILIMLALGGVVASPVAHAETREDKGGLRGPGGVALEQAMIAKQPDDRAGLRGPGAFASAQITTVTRPDDLATRRAPKASDTTQTSLHPDDRGGAKGPGAFTTYVAVPSSNGFDWDDAIVGGVAGAGMALLLLGGCLLLISRRSTPEFA